MINTLNDNLYNGRNISFELASDNCKQIAKLKEHVLLGISPFNSYYSEQKIAELIQFGLTFKNFHLFVPDTLPYFNFIALGYSHKDATHKTKRQWNYLRNKITKAFTVIDPNLDVDTKLITISKYLCTNKVYNELHHACTLKYESDIMFKTKCLAATKAIFPEINAIDEEKLNIAAKYLLAELPLCFDTPRILNIDVSSLFVYHNKIDFFANLYIDRDKKLLANNQGHLILRL